MSVWKNFQKLIHLNPIRGRNNPADQGVEDYDQQVPGSERHKETPDILDGIRFSDIFQEEMKNTIS